MVCSCSNEISGVTAECNFPNKGAKFAVGRSARTSFSSYWGQIVADQETDVEVSTSSSTSVGVGSGRSLGCSLVAESVDAENCAPSV